MGAIAGAATLETRHYHVTLSVYVPYDAAIPFLYLSLDKGTMVSSNSEHTAANANEPQRHVRQLQLADGKVQSVEWYLLCDSIYSKSKGMC